jgi:hypothetical protein
VRYSGTPDDGLILQENVHGQRTAFMDNWPNRARFWLPSVDHPADKATVRFTVHAPAAWRVIANGRLVTEAGPTPAGAIGPAGERRTWVWSADQPIPVYGQSATVILPRVRRSEPLVTSWRRERFRSNRPCIGDNLAYRAPVGRGTTRRAPALWSHSLLEP